MTHVDRTDVDFRACDVTLADLIELQGDAERRGFSTRWTSVDALRAQVDDGPILLMTLLRGERHGALRAYRCLVRFRPRDQSEGDPVVTTLDVAPNRLNTFTASNCDHRHLGGDMERLPVVGKP